MIQWKRQNHEQNKNDKKTNNNIDASLTKQRVSNGVPSKTDMNSIDSEDSAMYGYFYHKVAELLSFTPHLLCF